MSSLAHLQSSKRQWCLLLLVLTLLLAACSSGQQHTTNAGSTITPSSSPKLSPTINTTLTVCPETLKGLSTCMTPYSMRVAYGMDSLLAQGFTGKGQTVVDIVSYGSPTLQQDMDTFDHQFNLPAITVQILTPLGKPNFQDHNGDVAGWEEETTLDVELIHAMAPDAGIIVMASPVDETEGTIGMPEFLQLEQYAVKHKLGQIFSQSYVASEITLADAQGKQLTQDFTTFYQQATTQDGWTVLSGSGDHGATDYSNLQATEMADKRTINFPADLPWVTAVGGTSIRFTSFLTSETAWPDSGGGVSVDVNEPDYQKTLPANIQQTLQGHRGVPDVSADADPGTAMAIFFGGTWLMVGGTSAATPTWAGIIAVADQMAGHGLGSINQGLYKVATSSRVSQDFRDITVGNNSFNNVQGFPAQSGWDFVTGWGSPIGSNLLPDLINALKTS